MLRKLFENSGLLEVRRKLGFILGRLRGRLMLHDMPLNRDRGKTDNGGEDAVLHDPDTALAGGCILPNEVRLTGAEKVRCTRDAPLGGDSGESDNRGDDAG